MNRYEILKNRLGLSGGIGSKQTTEGYAGGGWGGDNPAPAPKKQLSYDQINQWSGFVEGNPNLKGMDAMWTAFSNKFPNSGIDRNVLTQNLDNLTRMTQDGVNRYGNTGGITTGLSFPKMTFNGKDYGRVNALMQTQNPIPAMKNQFPDKFIQKSIPNEVTEFWYDEEKGLYAYNDPWEGVVKYAAKTAANDSHIKKLSEQQSARKLEQ